MFTASFVSDSGSIVVEFDPSTGAALGLSAGEPYVAESIAELATLVSLAAAAAAATAAAAAVSRT